MIKLYQIELSDLRWYLQTVGGEVISLPTRQAMKSVCPQHVAGTADAERAMRGRDAFVAAMFIFPPPSLVRCLHAAAKGFPPSQVLDCKSGLLSSRISRGEGAHLYSNFGLLKPNAVLLHGNLNRLPLHNHNPCGDAWLWRYSRSALSSSVCRPS